VLGDSRRPGSHDVPELTSTRRALILRTHPYVRVYCALLLVIAAALSASASRLVAVGALTAVFAGVSGVGWRRALWGVVPVASLVGGVAILSALSGMQAREYRLEPVAMFAGRCYVAYLATAALIASTHYADALQALDVLRVPALLTSVAGSICRWFYVVWSEASSANTARVLRGGDLKSRLEQFGDLARLSASVMTRSFLRAERVAAAMECRGFKGVLVRLPGRPMRAADVVPLVVAAACLAAIWMTLP